MRLVKDSTPFSMSEDGAKIEGGSKISEIVTVTLASNATFYAVTATKPFKSVYLKCDTETKHMFISDIEAGTTFMRIDDDTTFVLPFGGPAGIVCYVKPETNGNKVNAMFFD